MLELRNLVKIYKTKGGAEVRALDGVSLKFGEKGMVFLLGKSGSGKSTLLNVCGGLDTPDGGEIIIKGRSSRDFSQSDFDSYRNTFVGFVFQEYNILNEFSVEDNIALALELQGKNKNRERVHEILKQVELEDFAKRKPNTLSGGQKQRVAIARALVKNPEIIMADEPTGALDSATGKQVFDTLKKLSEQKLVIVVSHDREFAEIYGDRIIELKDGKVIADVTKTKVEPKESGENITFVGDDTLTIKNGAQLTQSDVQKINEFLLSAPKDLIISRGERQIADFKKAARIDDEGARETFGQTDEGKIVTPAYTAQDSAFIRSSLPMRHAVRIGASSMKVKPFRLFFTIFLSFISFTLFGLFSTLSFYDPAQTAAQNYLDTGLAAARVRKMYVTEEIYYNTASYADDREEYDRYSRSEYTAFTPAELNDMREQYGREALGFINYADSDSYYDTQLSIRNAGYLTSDYYSANLGAFATFVPEAWQDAMLTDTDLSALGDDEIVISSYTFDSLYNAGIRDENGEEVTFNRYDDIVGRQLEISAPGSGDSKWLTVAGVYQNDLPERFDSLKSSAFIDQNYYELRYELQSLLEYGAYNVALVSDGFYTANADVFAAKDEYYGFTDLLDYLEIETEVLTDPESDYNYNYYIDCVNSLPTEGGQRVPPIAFFDGREENTLNAHEIVISIGDLQEDIRYALDEYYALLYEQANELMPTDPEQAESLYALADSTSAEVYESLQILINGTYEVIEETEGGIVSTYVDATDEDYERAASQINDFINDYFSRTGRDGFNHTIHLSGLDYGEFSVAGFFYGVSSSSMSGAYFSSLDCENIIETADRISYKTVVTNYTRPADAMYDYIYITLPGDYNGLYNLSRGDAAIGADDSYIVLDTAVSDTLYSINYVIDMLSTVFLWVGLVLAVFSMLLLFNFISVSITYKKKEIGILRAVGARSADVFKIFYSESAIITAICFVLGMIASFVACAIINAQLAPEFGVAILVFGPLSWLVMLGIAVVTSLIATFLPVYGIAKRKPVDSIRAL